ncbi:uncharacterized protein LOC108665349 [Hyalella azteca]|uniref:Uncharacterized protein LOC108665349 n=1 Tax=Hyalella azteca TaxID=294128 RepID=A0A8B7N2B0_HYAAZ|nr:uncharacterized protein LOC108665349 [Hyalella azteca]XP_047736050.1 uncharacterized protein LOC108665349 [Hyalella azteca]XP_047736051.1 uncharacterized protein LOC108665349 [Hyalella azteca]
MGWTCGQVKLVTWCVCWLCAAVIGIILPQFPDVRGGWKIALYVLVVVLAVSPVIAIIVELDRLVNAVRAHVAEQTPSSPIHHHEIQQNGTVPDVPNIVVCPVDVHQSGSPSAGAKPVSKFFKSWADLKTLRKSGYEELPKNEDKMSAVKTDSENTFQYLNVNACMNTNVPAVMPGEISDSLDEEYFETDEGAVIVVKKVSRSDAIRNMKLNSEPAMPVPQDEQASS